MHEPSRLSKRPTPVRHLSSTLTLTPALIGGVGDVPELCGFTFDSGRGVTLTPTLTLSLSLSLSFSLSLSKLGTLSTEIRLEVRGALGREDKDRPPPDASEDFKEAYRLAPGMVDTYLR